MARTYASSLFIGAALVFAGMTGPTRADMFDVKGVDVAKGERELAFALAPQRGFPVNSDFVRLHGEATFGYGFTSWFKAGGKLGFELMDNGSQDASYAGIETQAMLLDPSKGRLGLGWFTGLDVGFSGGFGEVLTFGPLASLEIAKGLSVTVNPLFQKSWNSGATGIDFNYAWQVKREINDRLGVGVEGYGAVPDIGHATPIEFQEHRIGPIVYLSHDMGGGVGGGSMKLGGAGEGDAKGAKAELQFGILFGFTDATPDTTGRAKLAITW